MKKTFKFYFALIMIVFVTVTSCKKTSTPTPVAPSSHTAVTPNDSIIYNTYTVDSINFLSDSVLYDVNNDNVNDIIVKMHHSLSGSTMSYNGIISGINNNMEFCYINTQSSWSMLVLNDSINAIRSLNWNSVCSYGGTTPYFSGSNSWAQGIFTEYFGFKITLNSINYFGWFHFKYQAISETGLNLAPNKTIYVGQKM